jgi:hypothetical protein
MQIGTAAGGIGVPFSFNLTYLPAIIHYNPGANPLTSLRIESQEKGVMHDWNAAAIAAENGFMAVGPRTANEVWLRVADGELRPQNVTISGVTSAVGAVNFFAVSANKGLAAYKSSSLALLALNPTSIEKFTACFIPAMAAGDYAEVTYDDGHSQRWDSTDLLEAAAQYQEVPGIIINNVDGRIKQCYVRVAVQQTAYLLSVIPPK